MSAAAGLVQAARAAGDPGARAALDAALSGLSPLEAAALWYRWEFWARPEQIPPPGDWDTWMLCTGIGFGKTRSGAEWCRAEVEAGRGTRIALVGATAADVRDTMVEGESGILAISPPWFRPIYEPSKRRLTWPNGAIATCFSAEEPDRLRGPNIDRAWCDELAAWEHLEATWMNLQGRMRLGAYPRVCVTTTPRPIALIRELAADPATVVVRGSTRANAANLPDRYKRQLKRHEGTDYGRQEVEGEILDDRQGAVFSGAWIQRCASAPELVRVGIGVDPAVSTSKTSDETGIVAAGIDALGNAYVLEDSSGKYTPDGWSTKVIEQFDHHMADVVVPEINKGGQMVTHTIRTTLEAAGRKTIEVPIDEVHASRGKLTRAEPIAALYQQRRVFHVGPADKFTKLEKEMINWDPARTVSPNRIDALVWILTKLALGDDGSPTDTVALPSPGARLDPLNERRREDYLPTRGGGFAAGWGGSTAGRRSI